MRSEEQKENQGGQIPQPREEERLKEKLRQFVPCSLCVLSHFSCVRLFVTLWTIAHLAPLPMGFSRQEYWSGLPCLPPGDLPDPCIESASLMSPALAGGFFTTSATWEAQKKD